MKKFWEMSKMPIVIGTIAALLFCVDSVLAKYLWSLTGINSGFMWIAFVAWTITFGMNTKDKVKTWIGHIIGFLAAVGIIYFGQIFDINVIGIGIASVIGVFVFNGLVMYFDNFKKYWINSITGIFMGIFLTFSGLGVGLGPNTWGNTFLTLGILLLYSLLGMVCAFFSVFLHNKWKTKLKTEDISSK